MFVVAYAYGKKARNDGVDVYVALGVDPDLVHQRPHPLALALKRLALEYLADAGGDGERLRLNLRAGLPHLCRRLHLAQGAVEPAELAVYAGKALVLRSRVDVAVGVEV